MHCDPKLCACESCLNWLGAPEPIAPEQVKDPVGYPKVKSGDKAIKE